MSLSELLGGIPIARALHSKNHSTRKITPLGITDHFDASRGSDASAVGWFTDPACNVSYDFLVLDDGSIILIHDDPLTNCAWHDGVCLIQSGLPIGHLTKDGTGKPIAPFAYGMANHGYFGVSATTGGDPDGTGPLKPKQVTMKQGVALILLNLTLVEYGLKHLGWLTTPAAMLRHIHGHEDIAIINPKDEPGMKSRWGQLGRKNDPTGDDPKRPIYSTSGVRDSVSRCLVDRAYRDMFIHLHGDWPA